jgi:hypothetical protein
MIITFEILPSILKMVAPTNDKRNKLKLYSIGKR